MVLKAVLIFSVCYLELVFAGLEELDHRPTRCHLKTIFCPCKDRNGVKLNATVKTCARDHNVCSEKAILTKCKTKGRHRRNTGSGNLNCNNGIILPSEPSELKGPPKVYIDGDSHLAHLDKDARFRCSVFSNLSANVTWLFNGVALVAEKNRHSYLECKTVLYIDNVLSRDAGNYTCVVRNEIGQAMASSSLSVNSKGKGPHIQDMKLEDNNGNIAFTGTTVNLTCKSQDWHVQNIFRKDGSTIKEGDGKHYEFFHMPDEENNVKIANLEIKNVTMEDAGNYTCYAILNGLPSQATFHLIVVNISQACNPGYYCPPGSMHPIPCPSGTYQPNMGQSSALACKQCPDIVINNLNKPDHINTPAVNFTDCLVVNNSNQPTEFIKKHGPSTSKSLTSTEIILIVAGMLGMSVITLLVFYCVAKKKCWLSSYSSRTTKLYDPESLPCEAVFEHSECQLHGSCENIQNAECAEIVKKTPEIDYETKYDVFICYSFKDVSWVKDLFAELEKRGFSCCIDFKDFLPGVPIVENISRAICYSRKTIAVLSPDFVNSDWCSHELQKALTRIKFHQVVPVVYKNCEIPMILQDRTYLDWENCHVKPYFWDHLEKALRQPNDGVV